MLASLIWLPLPIIAATGLVFVAGHDALDHVRTDSLGAWASLWHLAHEQGFLVFAGSPATFVIYPAIPWNGVMALGLFWQHNELACRTPYSHHWVMRCLPAFALRYSAQSAHLWRPHRVDQFIGRRDRYQRLFERAGVSRLAAVLRNNSRDFTSVPRLV
jgi:uncharacterized membrane protein